MSNETFSQGPDKDLPIKTPPSGASRGTKIVLAISLALNLAVAGMVVGAVLDGGKGGRHTMGRDLSFGPFHAALSGADRRALAKYLIAKSPDMREARALMTADIERILEIIRQEPLDLAALDAAFDAQNARANANFAAAQTAIRDFLVAMSAQERSAFAVRLQDGIATGRGKGN